MPKKSKPPEDLASFTDVQVSVSVCYQEVDVDQVNNKRVHN